jgi:hypothetical protein
VAETKQLLGLIDEFGSAFADPEAFSPPPPSFTFKEPDEEGKTGETEQTETKSYDRLLTQIEQDTELLKIAIAFLEQLAVVAMKKKQAPVIAAVKAEAMALDLPETYAREGSADCPSGMCPIDH